MNSAAGLGDETGGETGVDSGRLDSSLDTGNVSGACAAALRKSLADLGWPQLLEAIAQRAHTARGARAVLDSRFFDSVEEAQARLVECREARTLRALGASLPFGSITDVREATARALKGGVLDAEGLLAVGRAARGCQRLREHLVRHASQAPRLAELAEPIVDMSGLYEPIEQAFDDHGALADHASATLGALRRTAVQLRGKLEQRAQRMVDDTRYTDHLQDAYFTQRDERYVIPVKLASRGRVRGIVHGTSQSGQTVFIEPEEILELNNALKLAECDVADEERRIFAMLSACVGDDAGALYAALDTAELLDVIAAQARLADDLEATVQIVDSDGRMNLLVARHPLMALSERACVPNDLQLEPGSVLVISGPNAGGKTVALKTAGLMTLMTRAGLHIPAEAGSRVPWFPFVFTDIGDSQSIENDLSTFSAHLRQLDLFLGHADSPEFGGSFAQPTLLLIDEIAVGTEPEQGAALAQAVLEAFAERGVATIVTTHYEVLKELAAAHPRFENASVGFDLERMMPTFQLHMGTPGSSGALRVAARMGLPEDVLERAHTLLGGERTRVEEMLDSLEQTRRELEDERSALEEARAAAESARRDAEAARARADETRRKLHASLYDGALEALRQARTELDEMRVRVKKRSGAEKMQAAANREQLAANREQLAANREQLAALSGRLSENAPQKPAPPGRPAQSEDLVANVAVFVVSLQAKGVVLAAPDRGKVAVQVGPLKTSAAVSDVTILPAAPTGQSSRGAPRHRSSTGRSVQPPAASSASGAAPAMAYARTADASVDVRGERAHEAVARVDRFIDQSLRVERECLFVIHGRGTGALRRAVRELLAGHHSIAHFRSGEPSEGGDGVTVAWLG